MATLLGADPTDPAIQAAAVKAPDYIHPDYATPQQIEYLRQMSTQLMQPQPVAHWAQGLAEMARALAGTHLNNEANDQQKLAMALGASAGAPVNAMASGHPFSSATAASTPPAGASTAVVSAPLAPPGSTVSSGPLNNPGNIRGLRPDGSINPWVAKLPGFQGVGKGGFAVFDTPDSGAAAMAANMHSYASQGIDTLNKLTAKWAPFGDGANNPVAYAQRLAQATGIDPNAKIDLTDPAIVSRIIPPMAAVEQGRPMAVVHPGAPRPASVSAYGGPTALTSTGQPVQTDTAGNAIDAATGQPTAAAPAQGGPQDGPSGIPGMTAQQFSSLMSNPWVPDSQKQLAMALITPKTVEMPFGGTGIYRLGVPGVQPLVPGSKIIDTEVAGGKFPMVVSGDAQNPTVRPLVPNTGGQPATGGVAGAQPAGPLDAFKPIVEQASQMAARTDEIKDEAKNTVDTLAKYKEAGVEAQGKTSQIDAVGKLGDKVGYGIVPWVKQQLGERGIDTSGYTDIQAYQAAIDNLAPTLRPEGSGRLLGSELTAFKGALGGLMVTPEGRQIAAQNMKLLTHYQIQMGEIAGNTNLSPDERMAKIQALPPPKLQLSVGPSPSEATSSSNPTTPDSQGGSLAPPAQGARQASDGKWYVPDPKRPGKYLRVES